jgi:U4/U6 small nuclear ribonucleoprotein PRP3
MREEAQLEALKQRIAESTRKAGLDSEFETLEKNIKVPSSGKPSPNKFD